MPSTCFRRAIGAVLLSLALPVVAQNIVPDMDNATTIWDNACAACHGELGQGAHSGIPDIRNSALDLSQVILVVKTGSNAMPAFAGFTQQELLDISTYVLNEL